MSDWSNYFIPAEQAVQGAAAGGLNDLEAGGGANQTTNITPNVGNQQGFLQQVMAMGAPQGTTVQWKVGPDGGFVLQAFDPSGQPIPGMQQTIAADSSPNFIRDGALLIAGGYFGGSALAGAAGEGGAAAAAGYGGEGAAAAGEGFAGAGYGGEAAALGGGEASLGGAGEAVAGGSTPLSSVGQVGAAEASTVTPAMAGSAGGGISWGNAAQLLGTGLATYSSLEAARRQAGAAGHAADLQNQQYQQTRADLQPWMQAGRTALGQIGDMNGYFTHQFNADDLKTNLAPNYQWQLDQGLGATQNLMNKGGGLLSGNTLKGINDYAQNYAGGAYQQAFNNYNAQRTNIFNTLSNIAGLGQTANQTSATAGTNAASNIGNYLTSGAAAGAAGTVGASNAVNNGIGNYLGWNYLNGGRGP